MPVPAANSPASAPPNFYSQVGQMSSGPGASASAATQAANGAGAAQPGPGQDPDHDFLETVTQLMSVLQKIGQMKPRGQDISKFTQAAADTMKDCVKQVFSSDPNQPQPGQGGQPGATAPDTGVGSGAAVSPSLAM